MTYHVQWQLTYDDAFVNRCRACLTEQANIFQNDGRADMAALAKSILRGDDPSELATFQTMGGAAAGFADAVDNGDGTIDSTKITDAQILAVVQQGWPVVASLYYTSMGEPVP